FGKRHHRCSFPFTSASLLRIFDTWIVKMLAKKSLIKQNISTGGTTFLVWLTISGYGIFLRLL
ncbi:MAG: hypothetical protein AB8V19_01500, partial [Candidatus Midichloria sp.]